MKGKNSKRGAGILLHISSLPSKYGIGSLGGVAYDFVDFLALAGQSYWQILPLNPTGISNSPYQSYSSSAFNPNFIDLEQLNKCGLLTTSELELAKSKTVSKINFRAVNRNRSKLLRKAFQRFDIESQDFASFKQENRFNEYACYMTLKQKFDNLPWHLWDKEYKYRDGAAKKKLLIDSKSEIDFHIWTQFIFLNQWHSLKSYANSKGISIIGDMPIYLDYDSDISWSNGKLLQLDGNLEPIAVAGVPPDYFSETGQLWGNPLYDWEYHRKTKFKWWKERINAACDIFDYLRIDHFRGFHRYYSIKANAKTAMDGMWLDGAGTELFYALSNRTKSQIIAEDLGLLDDGAINFFKTLGFPGMKVLQFAFDGNADNPHLPINHISNSIVYTGTHDNDTLKGWLQAIRSNKAVFQNVLKTVREIKANVRMRDTNEICRLLIETTLGSISNICIVPMQDYLYHNSKYRMNTPGTVSDNNWSYKLQEIPYNIVSDIRKLTQKHKRI